MEGAKAEDEKDDKGLPPLPPNVDPLLGMDVLNELFLNFTKKFS